MPDHKKGVYRQRDPYKKFDINLLLNLFSMSLVRVRKSMFRSSIDGYI